MGRASAPSGTRTALAQSPPMGQTDIAVGVNGREGIFSAALGEISFGRDPGCLVRLDLDHVGPRHLLLHSRRLGGRPSAPTRPTACTSRARRSPGCRSARRWHCAWAIRTMGR